MPAEGEELPADESAPKAGTDISGETYENSRFRRMSRERFNALALWGLSQELRNSAEGCSFWSADNERQLAMVFLDSEEGDFWVVVVMRDLFDRFMPVGVNGPFPTARFAEHTLQTNLGESAKLLEPKVGASAGKSAGTDLLTPIDGVSRVDRAFAYLRDGVNQSAARELIVELSRWLPDMDGNLARDFQTTGYSARVWEFYLRLAFYEMNFLIGSEHAAPDFQLSRDGQEIFVEATTANPAETMDAAIGSGAPPERPEDFWGYIEKEMPLRFGSSLHSKMAKRYWELPHVAGKPLVFAIADFHSPASMTWSHTAIPIYLYGRSAIVGMDEIGKTTGAEKRVDHFKKGKNEIMPFFEQPDSEHISAVLFSNAGTISKFNRIGVLAGFGDKFVRIRRIGGLNDPSPGAFDPIAFDVNIESPNYAEGWADELEMHHNPRALHPIDDEMFPGIAHFRIDEGEGVWRGPSPRVLFSHTVTLDLLRREAKHKGLAE